MSYTRSSRRAAAVALLVTVLAAVPARADSQTATAGAVTATLSFERVDEFRIDDPRLAVTRAGVPAYDAPLVTDLCSEPLCALAGGDRRDSVRAVDLDGDGEPEVLADLFTGGAHCCFATALLSWDGAAYRALERNWGDPGYRLKDAGGDARPELVSADPRFAYAFSAFAFSGMPVQVLRFRGGRLEDVTRRLRGVVRADARRWMRAYRRAPRRYQPEGVLAAWAADRYQLGRHRSALRFVRREVRSGKLRAMHGRRAFARRLDRRLRRWGY